MADITNETSTNVNTDPKNVQDLTIFVCIINFIKISDKTITFKYDLTLSLLILPVWIFLFPENY